MKGSAAAVSAMTKRDDADVFVDVRNVKLNYKAGDSSTLALEQTNMKLKNGDVVYVTPGNQVSVLGMVNKPGRFPIENSKMYITDVLTLAERIVVLIDAVFMGFRLDLPLDLDPDMRQRAVSDLADAVVAIQG